MSQLQIELALMREMTNDQELQYTKLHKIGWEFCCWDGDDVIMQLWQHNTMDSRSLVSEVMITPSGTVIKMDKPRSQSKISAYMTTQTRCVVSSGKTNDYTILCALP